MSSLMTRVIGEVMPGMIYIETPGYLPHESLPLRRGLMAT